MKKQIITRLKHAKREISSMIIKLEENESCIDIIMLSKNVQKTLREVDSILVHDHLNKSLNKFIETNLSDEYLKEVMKGVKYL